MFADHLIDGPDIIETLFVLGNPEFMPGGVEFVGWDRAPKNLARWLIIPNLR